jgi:two-component system, cell cycle response regulator
MPATSSDVAALGARLRALTIGRLVTAAAISLTLASVGSSLIDPGGAELLVGVGIVHGLVNLLVLLLPDRPTPQRLALEATTVVDAAAIAVVLVVTGGVTSPFAPLAFAEVVALTLVFGWRTGVRATILLSLGIVWALATTPPSLDAAVGTIAASDPALAATLEPGTRALLLLVGLWAVMALIASLSGVTERELRHWLDDLALLRDVTHDLDPRQGVTEVCAALASTLTGPMSYRSAVIWLTDDEDPTSLRPCSAAGKLAGPAVGAEARDHVLRTTDAPIHRALTSDLPTPVRRADARAEVLADVHGDETGLVVLPLRLEGRLLGVVTAEVPGRLGGPPQVSGRDLRRLRLLADEATLLLANATLQAELRALSVTDALTGLPNHRFLQQRLGEEVERVVRRAARGEDRPLSLALFDLDHFKTVNDTYGHPTGDAVLRAVARTTSSVLRSSDVACRYGGEEFAVVLVDTTGPEAMRACERIAEAIRALELTDDGGQPLGRVTASFGVATTVGVGLDRPGLIAAADRALYGAKRDGRDRVRHADDLDDEESDILAVSVQVPTARDADVTDSRHRW